MPTRLAQTFSGLRGEAARVAQASACAPHPIFVTGHEFTRAISIATDWALAPAPSKQKNSPLSQARAGCFQKIILFSKFSVWLRRHSRRSLRCCSRRHRIFPSHRHRCASIRIRRNLKRPMPFDTFQFPGSAGHRKRTFDVRRLAVFHWGRVMYACEEFVAIFHRRHTRRR